MSFTDQQKLDLLCRTSVFFKKHRGLVIIAPFFGDLIQMAPRQIQEFGIGYRRLEYIARTVKEKTGFDLGTKFKGCDNYDFNEAKRFVFMGFPPVYAWCIN